MPHFAQEKTDLFEGFIVKNATELFKCACCFNLEECRWSDLTLVNFSNSFKHFSLLDDELKLLLECYKALYPNKEIKLSSSIARKYSNVMLGTEKFGSKMDCRNLRSARVMASWSADDGSIDTSVPKRPGIVNFYFVHNVKLNAEFCQHAFAVVWWYNADHDQGYFGKPAQVWKPFDYKPCGPALFMPVQRIWLKFACCSMKINEPEKLVISPIPRLFH